MPADAHAVGVPPDAAVHAAQRLLDWIGDDPEASGMVADVRLVAEALVGMGARSANPAETCAHIISSRSDEPREPGPSATQAWFDAQRDNGNGEALKRAVETLDRFGRFAALEDFTAVKLARDVVALHAEVVRLRKALEAVLADDGNCTAGEPADSSCPRCLARAALGREA